VASAIIIAAVAIITTQKTKIRTSEIGGQNQSRTL
jgi:hypothetical protein